MNENRRVVDDLLFVFFYNRVIYYGIKYTFLDKKSILKNNYIDLFIQFDVGVRKLKRMFVHINFKYSYVATLKSKTHLID